MRFDTPGTYVYRVCEMSPAESGTSGLPGMTYDSEEYTVTVVVSYNMTISVTVTDKAGKTIKSEKGNNSITKSTGDSYVLPFTNHFDSSKVYYVMAAEMAYTDWSRVDKDGHTLNVVGEVSGKFGFTMRPVGGNAATAPMPNDEYTSDTRTGLQGSGADRVYYAKNVNDRVPFEADAAHAIEFDENHRGTFSYELAEIIPDDALYIGDG